MLAFPVIAFAIALIVIGRGSSRMYLEERRRDRLARKAMLALGIVILIASIGSFFL